MQHVGVKEKITDSLQSMFIFDGLSPDQLEQLLSSLVEVRVPAKTRVIREGDSGDTLYMLCAGSLVVSKEGPWEGGKRKPPVVSRPPPSPSFSSLILVLGYY
jgi:hypothetical protein